MNVNSRGYQILQKSLVRATSQDEAKSPTPSETSLLDISFSQLIPWQSPMEDTSVLSHHDSIVLSGDADNFDIRNYTELHCGVVEVAEGPGFEERADNHHGGVVTELGGGGGGDMAEGPGFDERVDNHHGGVVTELDGGGGGDMAEGPGFDERVDNHHGIVVTELGGGGDDDGGDMAEGPGFEECVDNHHGGVVTELGGGGDMAEGRGFDVRVDNHHGGVVTELDGGGGGDMAEGRGFDERVDNHHGGVVTELGGGGGGDMAEGPGSDERVDNHQGGVVTELGGGGDDDGGDMAEGPGFGGRKKKRKGRENWGKAIRKREREHGKTYEGRLYDAAGKYTGVTKEAREIGARCSCKPTNNTCKDIVDDVRKRIFQNVWTMSWEEKCVFVNSMVDRVPCKRRKITEEDFKKSVSFKYHLKVEGERKKVCFGFFLSTTGLKETWVRDQLKKQEANDNEGEVNGKTRKIKEMSEKKKKLVEFLQCLPKVESHYCRKNTSKLYLEPLFGSLSAVYQLYKSSCADPLSRFAFEEQFHEMNLSLFKPRKDQCDLCFSYQEGNVDDSVYAHHREKKERAQREKVMDKEMASENSSKTKVITVDLQSVLLCPMIKASALYYRTKLCIHNYTVFDVASKDVCCYVWNESEGGLSANEYASCLVDYLSEFLGDYDCFIVYSDGCSAQNRNAILSCALSYFSMKHNVIVIQKILEKGHTQMEVDSVHSCIERELKNKKIQIPGDYVTHIEAARKLPKPYRVKHLKFDFFQNFSKVKTLTSIRPGRHTGDPTVTDLRCLLYKPSGLIQYKINYDDQWEDLPMRRSDLLHIVEDPKPLHQSRLKISDTKFKHLQELKPVIHADYHQYYDALPH